MGSFQKTYNCLDNSVVSFEVFFLIPTKELNRKMVVVN